MTNYKKQFISVVTTATMLLNLATPVLAGTLEVSGNGYDSDNEIEVKTQTSTTVVQNNNAVVSNKVVTGSSTGGNSVSKNTGGDSSVTTGDADARVNITNKLNSNSASIDCCKADDLSAIISGNGADSENEIEVKQKSATGIYQDNKAEVENVVLADTDTGDNKADKNTNGDVTVTTGDADTRVGVSTTANSNSAKIGGTGENTGSLEAEISGNGYDSENEIELKLKQDTSVYQDNSARVGNTVVADANTGDNQANKNTSGDVEIETGDAMVIAGIDNKLNFNWADINCCSAFDVTAKIADNGADSENEIELKLGNSTVVTQDNDAYVQNAIYAAANTGYNKANKNTGGAVDVTTGDADVLVGIDNMLNFNWADVDCCVTELTAKIKGNGADSENEIEVKERNNNGTWQANLAALGNDLLSDGDTGYNKANKNTGDSAGDPSVSTGDSSTMTSVANAANVNAMGTTPSPLPEVDFDFEISWSWAHFLSMFHWL